MGLERFIAVPAAGFRLAGSLCPENTVMTTATAPIRDRIAHRLDELARMVEGCCPSIRPALLAIATRSPLTCASWLGRADVDLRKHMCRSPPWAASCCSRCSVSGTNAAAR